MWCGFVVDLGLCCNVLFIAALLVICDMDAAASSADGCISMNLLMHGCNRILSKTLHN